MTAPGPAAAAPFRFELLHRGASTRARRGRIVTPHGTAETPAFMPVGTAATVKGVLPRELAQTGSEIVLANTYHLALRPGDDVVRELGGLHAFMRWSGPILTDSGGYQVFSLPSLRTVDRDGVTFRSHLDGSLLRLDPERAIAIQRHLGSDILMVFDECLPHATPRDEVARSLWERTTPWAERALAVHPGPGRALFAIGQGGLHEDLRADHLRVLRDLPFEGFAIGGLSVGETDRDFRRMIAVSTEVMPEDRPRYLMGVGSVREILDAVHLGVDMFDCVLPTRNGRNGQALTAAGPLQLRNARFRRDPEPLENDCGCPTCSGGFSRAYLRHLFMAKEMLGPILLTLHNLTFMQRLMRGARDAIERDGFEAFRAEALAGWEPEGAASEAP